MFTFGKVNSELRREGGERGLWFAAFVQGVCADGEWEASTRAEVVTLLLDASFWLPTVFAGDICWDTCVGNQKTLPAHLWTGGTPSVIVNIGCFARCFALDFFFSCLSVLCFLLTISQQQRRRAGLHERGYQNVVFHPVVFSVVSGAGV